MNTHKPINTDVISAQKLRIGYSEKPLTYCPNLVLNQGTVTALLGANGAGKSTLIHTLAGLHNCISGSISIEKKALKSFSRQALAKQISLVLTHKEPLGTMTVQELVGLGRAPYTGWHGKLSEQDQTHITQAIAWVGMESFTHRKVDSLSDGERQKAMIARALAQNTPIMILDEPTAHLDLSNRLEVFQLMNHLAQHLNKAILLSTHELELALHQSDYLWLMDGNKEELVQGLPEDLVLQGAIDQAFPSLKFQWQQASHWLEMPKKSIRYTDKVWIESTDLPALQWTKHALQRLGFEVIEQSQEANFSIHIKREGTTLTWRVVGKSFHSIQQLSELLLEKKP